MDESSLYLPAPIAEEIDQVHEEYGREIDPKWRTVVRAVRQFGDGGGDK